MLFVLFLLLQSQPAVCRDVSECRTEAQAAQARGEFEVFHDLAWRAVQKGRANDPELMQLLARAQALSGRPGDALVMLERLADLGVHTDAATSADFAVVRLLPGWRALEAKLTGNSSAPTPSATPPPSPEPTSATATSGGSAPAPPVPAARTPAAGTPPTMAAPSSPASPDATAAPAAPSPTSRVTLPAADRLEFDAPGLDAHGLAHDAVSRRFVLGDRKAQRLLVVDEVSRRVVNYVSAASAGFYEEITAFTVDARRGDLWVVSVEGEGGAASSVLHKLQLVSGRGLMEARATEIALPVRLVDVAVSPEGVVYALDAAGSRILRLRPGAKTLEMVMRLEARRPTVLAIADDRTLYVGAEAGLLRIDLTARTAAPVKTAEKLTDFESLAWRNGALLGVQRLAGSSLIVRVPLDATGARANPRHVLAASPSAVVGALGGDTYYYLADDHTIRRLPLK